MKKVIFVFAVGLAIACNSGSDDSKTADTDAAKKDGGAATNASTPGGISQAESDKAVQLIASSDCLTCHQVEQKTTGPAYREVAQKYESTDANISMLADKIIKGGTGTWGVQVMTPHPDMPVEDAKLMVKYILSLKNTK